MYFGHARVGGRVDCCVVLCFVGRELPFHGSLLSISFDFKKSCYFHTLETEGTSFSWIPPIDIIYLSHTLDFRFFTESEMLPPLIEVPSGHRRCHK